MSYARLALLVFVAALSACSVANMAEAKRGKSDAERDIAAGKPHLLFIGLPGTERDVIDAATGLPKWSGGCELSDSRMAYVDAYNDAMCDALSDGRLAGMTLGHKITTHAAVAERFEKEKPVLLPFRGAPVVSPGGRFQIRFAPYDDHPNAVRFIYVTDSKTGKEQRTINPDGDSVPVLFDHGGTTLLVRDERFERYITIDLPRCIDMQTLPDPGRGW